MDWKALYAFLETARVGELFARRDAVYQLLHQRRLHDRGVIRDARRIVRLIDQELLARAEASAQGRGPHRQGGS